MRNERFVKINGVTYYESQLAVMSEGQLKDIIKECKKGIDEIQFKIDDYKKTNIGLEDDEHFKEVVARFNAASVFLQSDIVIIENIIKNRESDDSINTEWLATFYDVCRKNLATWKFLKFKKMTEELTGTVYKEN